MLVLGPSRAFLRYIAQVLPSLGEEAVVQTTIADIAPKAKVRVEEPMAVRRVKGDARMGEVLRRALAWPPSAPRRGRPPAGAVRSGDVEPGTRQRPRRLHRRPARSVQVGPAGAAGAPGQRGTVRVPLLGSARRRRGLVRGRAHLLRRVRCTPGHAVAHGLPHHPGARPPVVAWAAGALRLAACSRPTSGSCCCGPVAPPSRPRPGASTTWPCSTRPRSSSAVGAARTATSWWTRPRTSPRCSSA